MPKNWWDLLKDQIGALLADELQELIKNAKQDSADFIRKQGKKLELYLTQLAENKITKEQFEGYVRDIKALTEMQALKMSVAAKVRAQRLAKNIQRLIIDSLLKLV